MGSTVHLLPLLQDALVESIFPTGPSSGEEVRPAAAAAAEADTSAKKRKKKRKEKKILKVTCFYTSVLWYWCVL